MFPAEKPALLNTMARGITGHVIPDDTMSIYNLLDEASLNKIAESTAHRIWGGFITFGSATAGVFGILLVVRLVKLTVDTMIHGYALHSAYGCSLYVLGAIWSSLTHLLLYLARSTPNAIMLMDGKILKNDDHQDTWNQFHYNLQVHWTNPVIKQPHRR
ncbi:hypothetical protein X777_13882 [Ooceraea biroi]|uniref:Transmembrane protein n=2 Tax=Ooceraea biroi TaxID=2015173 RepID=A0A026VXL0_OOCBI|nr:hypothetical protein X777_13882 [Ooceraea biroi]